MQNFKKKQVVVPLTYFKFEYCMWSAESKSFLESQKVPIQSSSMTPILLSLFLGAVFAGGGTYFFSWRKVELYKEDAQKKAEILARAAIEKIQFQQDVIQKQNEEDRQKLSEERHLLREKEQRIGDSEQKIILREDRIDQRFEEIEKKFEGVRAKEEILQTELKKQEELRTTLQDELGKVAKMNE